jgi:hypothetical protein
MDSRTGSVSARAAAEGVASSMKRAANCAEVNNFVDFLRLGRYPSHIIKFSGIPAGIEHE